MRRRCRSTARARTRAESTVGSRRATARGAARCSAAGNCLCAKCGAEPARSATPETQAADPDVRLRDQQAGPRRAHASWSAAYGVPTTALRFFNVYGPGQALSNPYTGVAAIFASRLLNGRASRDVRGRAAVTRLHPRRPTSWPAIILALERRRAAGGASISERGDRVSDRGGCRGAFPRARFVDRARVPRRSIAQATSDTVSRIRRLRRELLGFHSKTTLEGWHGGISCCGWPIRKAVGEVLRNGH